MHVQKQNPWAYLDKIMQNDRNPQLLVMIG